MYFSFLLSMLLVPWLWFTVFSFLHFPPSPCSPSFFAEFSLFLCQLGGSVCYWHSLKFLSSFSFLLSFFFLGFFMNGFLFYISAFAMVPVMSFLTHFLFHLHLPWVLTSFYFPHMPSFPLI